MSHLTITHLTFIGTGVDAATVEFGPRMTLVHGPSDTGKSFIVNAIDFMLGAASLKEIPERQGYSTVLLGLSLPTGELATLARSVSGGSIALYRRDVRSGPLDVPDETLAPRHNPASEANISRYLLSLVGLDGRRVRKNIRNETDSLSFRNIAHLCIVDETQMQSEISPALTGSYVSKTKEISVLKLVLQDEDDSELIPVQSRSESMRLSSARIEVVDRLLADLYGQLGDAAEVPEIRAQLGRLDSAILEQGASIEKLTSIRDQVAAAYTTVQRDEAQMLHRLEDADALQARFSLLLKQYDSDLARLEMISEAGNLLGYFTPGVCVFCGAEPEHQHFNQLCEGDFTSFGESIEVERQKTSALRVDLLVTLEDLESERHSLRERLGQLNRQSGRLSERLAEADNSLRPHRSNLNQLLGVRTPLEKTLSIYDQISNLSQIRNQIEQDSQAETVAAVSNLDLGALREFSNEMALRMKAWEFPEASTVRYDRNEQDIVAGDQLRAAHGKGVRALLHAAFTISLAQYCFNRGIAYPGFVILDSPLVTYRPPDTSALESTPEEDVLDEGVVGAFYLDIQRNFDGQIIVMENMDPPVSLDNESADIFFTKLMNSGRYGFFSRYGLGQLDSSS